MLLWTGRDGGGGGGGHRGRRRFDPTLRFYIWAGTGVCLAGGYYVTHLDTVPITGKSLIDDGDGNNGDHDVMGSSVLLENLTLPLRHRS